MNSENTEKTVAIIPARYASTRFPGKPLTMISGKTMIERVYTQTSKAKRLSSVLVATDDERIVQAVKAFGGNVVLTSPAHPSGTDRLAEVASAQPDTAIIVNVQGDEPLIDPDSIDAAVEPLQADCQIELSTIAAPLTHKTDIENPNVVKVVLDAEGFALYFSREAIPHYRDAAAHGKQTYWGHVGLYVYRRSCLLRLAKLTPTPLEKAESLEQLRALENGIKIKVICGAYRSIAVDKPEDVAIVEKAIAGLASCSL